MAFGIPILKRFFGKQSATTEIKVQAPPAGKWGGVFSGRISTHHLKDELKETAERLFQRQSEEISNAVLLRDTADVKFFKVKANSTTPYRWINNGELIAGSYLINCLNKNIIANDIDIYFKTKEDSFKWLEINNIAPPGDIKNTNCIVLHRDSKINLVWGVTYSSTEELLSGFDIRACAIAYDPNLDELTYASGTIGDIDRKRIVYQTGVRNLSVHRLLKYLEKGFTIDEYQRVIFAELIKLGRHNSTIELASGKIYPQKKVVEDDY